MKPRVAVAVSGGRDSMALLHATRNAASALDVVVCALHVHHGLMPEADAWTSLVEAVCGRWKIPCLVHRLQGRPARGDSVEAWARRERYAALAQMAREGDVGLVLLAHHRGDQAETFMLQALRGAGPAGLSAMPAAFERDGMQWARPWLAMPRSTVDTYVRRHRLRFVDDASNTDPRFARSRLRAAVWPALVGAFEDAEVSLAASARRSHDAAAALVELAAEDLARMEAQDGLDIGRWMSLSAHRRSNALREWLRRQLGRGAPESLVERLCRELPAAKTPARWALYGGLELKRYRGTVRVDAPSVVPVAASTSRLDFSRPGTYRVPGWEGALRVFEVAEGGVAAARLQECELRPRIGAEQFQPSLNRPARSLKKQYQASSIPPWQRHAPLLWHGKLLLYVPGLGIDARALAEHGQAQRAFEWMDA